MPQQRDPLIMIIRDTVHDGEDLVLRTVPWRTRAQVIHCERVCICNHTNSGGDVTFGIVQGGHFVELCTVYGLLAGMWAHCHFPFTFLSEWEIYTKFHYENQGNGEACVDGDDCEMHVIGYVLEPYTSP